MTEMINPACPSSLLLILAGAKGAIGSTVATAAAAIQSNPEFILSSLTTADAFSFLPPPEAIRVVGWDTSVSNLPELIEKHGVLPETAWQPHRAELEKTVILAPPDGHLPLAGQVEKLRQDIRFFREKYPNSAAVFVNLLPAGLLTDLDEYESFDQLYSQVDGSLFPDLAYALAAVFSGIPVVNFTPNHLEFPLLLNEAVTRNVPVAGRDGKTGQTYLKVVLASALKARSLLVDGWYSVNILGNADGENLMNPDHAAGKLKNKTELLDDLLGYPVGKRYGAPSHKVRIDYYPPRGDAKEAWDVIDFSGMFGLPMSLRLNLLGRDSILAAPLVVDLARWVAALQLAGRSGLISELGFFFKAPLGTHPPLTFQDQFMQLEWLKMACEEKMAGKSPGLPV